MFLIEYEENKYINGEKIDWLWLNKAKDIVEFTCTGDNESCFIVKGEFKKTFINHLQALNNNISNIEE